MGLRAKLYAKLYVVPDLCLVINGEELYHIALFALSYVSRLEGPEERNAQLIGARHGHYGIDVVISDDLVVVAIFVVVGYADLVRIAWNQVNE